MSNSGIPMFSVSSVCNVGNRCDDISESLIKNETLFSAFLSGLFGLSEEFGGSLENITISNLVMFAYKFNEIVVVLITDPIESIEEQDSHKMRAKIIAELFYQTYNYYITKNKYYNTSQFRGFQKILEEANLADENADFKKNCENCIYDKACPHRIITGDPKISIKDKLAAIPKHNMIMKMKLMFKSMREYAPIDQQGLDIPQDHIKSIMVFHKINGIPQSIGYGCHNEPFGTITMFEQDFIKNEINYFKRKTPEKTVKIVKSPVHNHIAYGIMNSNNWAILVQYRFLNVSTLENSLNDIINQIDSLLEINDDMIQFQVIQEEQQVAFCEVCIEEKEEDCFAKRVLVEMKEKVA